MRDYWTKPVYIRLESIVVDKETAGREIELSAKNAQMTRLGRFSSREIQYGSESWSSMVSRRDWQWMAMLARRSRPTTKNHEISCQYGNTGN